MSNTQQLALLPSRDIVLFPGAEMPFFVGREATIRAIKYAQANHGGNLALFTQLRAENSGPLTRDDVFTVGTLTHIAASIELKDHTMKLMLEGVSRIRLHELSKVDEVTIVTVSPFPEASPSGEAAITDDEHKEILESLTKWSPDLGANCERPELQLVRKSKNLGTVVRALRILVASPNINKIGAQPKWFSPNNPPTVRYNELLNQAIARRQAVLEEQSLNRQLDLIQEALSFDISCRTEDLGASL